jgi:pimeloyl-ACP methyl ester carboxylesterase
MKRIHDKTLLTRLTLDKTLLRRLVVILPLVAGLMIGGIFVIDLLDLFGDGGDPEEDPNFFRDLRIDAWSHLIGDDSGILSVKKKLETMYGSDAPKNKVDLANNEFSEGNWHYEFVQLAEQSLEENNYLAATGYYAIAAFPFLYQDTRAPEIYDLALDAFQKALQHGQYPHKIITVNIDGVDIDAYLVYPQSYHDGDIVPAIVTTGGSDGLMPFVFADYLRYWNHAGIAWVSFDMPGHGTSKDLILTGDNADSIHIAVIEALRTDESIDKHNIFIYSRSLGGYAALRMLATNKADELDIAGIAAVCPIGESLFSNVWHSYFYMPKIELNIWGARVGVDPDKYFDMRVSDREFWGKPETSIPLLVHNTADDNINPVSEIKKMATLSTNGKYIIVEDEEGHCPPRGVALENVAKFVDENMR